MLPRRALRGVDDDLARRLVLVADVVEDQPAALPFRDAGDVILGERAAQLFVEIELGPFRQLAAFFLNAAGHLRDLLLHRVALAREVRFALEQRGVAVFLQDLADLCDLFQSLLVGLLLRGLELPGQPGPVRGNGLALAVEFFLLERDFLLEAELQLALGGCELAPLLVPDRGLDLDEPLTGDRVSAPGAPFGRHHTHENLHSLWFLVRPCTSF
jgi:hypothetical protein